MIASLIRAATGEAFSRAYSSQKKVFSPVMQVVMNSIKDRWEPAVNDIPPKYIFEKIKLADFPVKRNVELHQEPGNPPQRVSIHLSTENIGWVEVDEAGKPKNISPQSSLGNLASGQPS